MMNVGVFLTIMLAVFGVIGLPIALWSLWTGGPRKVKELFEHLLASGVKASLLPEFEYAQTSRKKRYSYFQLLAGTIRLQKQHIKMIDVVGTAQQYGVNYSIYYLILNPGLVTIKNKRKNTILRKQRESLMNRKSTEFIWEGNEQFAEKLNSNNTIRTDILKGQSKGGIEILFESGDEYVKIKTDYFLSDKDQFDALEVAAKSIRS